VHPVAVALIVIGVTVAITYYAFSQRLPISHPFHAYALMSDSVNVRGGDPVRIGGVNVGAVSSVTPQGSDTRIELNLDPAAQPVHRDASIRIRDRLFLEGSYYLELDPGSAAAPLLGNGAEIPPSQTAGPVQFFQVLSLLNAQARDDLAQTVETLDQGLGAPAGGGPADSGAAGLKQAATEFPPLLKDTSLISRGLRGTAPGDVHTLLAAGAGVTGTLAAGWTQLADLVQGLNQTSSALAASDGALARTVSGLDQTLIAAPPALTAIDSSLGPTTTLAQALDPALQQAPPILDRLIPTLRQLAAVLAPGRRGPLLAAVAATFRDLPSVLRQLAAAFPIGKQISDCLRTHVSPIMSSEVPDGSLSTGYSVLEDFMHSLPGIAGASGSFDANGPFTRFLVGAGTNTLSGSVGGQSLVATAPPGGQALQGARPQWVGDLTASDFRPDVPCSADQLPSLASPTAAPDFVPGGRGSVPAPLTRWPSGLTRTSGSAGSAGPGGSRAAPRPSPKPRRPAPRRPASPAASAPTATTTQPAPLQQAAGLIQQLVKGLGLP
jgi:ABC-type transporter Mla subunit MlaD